MLIRGERYKIEISEERYNIHKEGSPQINMTIESIESEWGIFILRRCFRSFHGKYYADLELMKQVANPEEGKRHIEGFTEFMQNLGKVEVSQKEYYKDK